jgi:tetratricopeptide (TPR) repeat protein
VGALGLAAAISMALVPRSPARADAVAAASIARARAEFDQGQAAYRAGDLKSALAHFQNAYALVPSAELEFDLGRTYERLGEADRAIKVFRAYLRRPEVGDDERAQIEARIADLIALRARQRAQVIEAPPKRAALTAEARAFFERGAKLFRRGRYEAALAAFSAAQDFAHLPELSYNLALTSERLGRWDDAIAFYRAYLREAKDTPDAAAVEARIRDIASGKREDTRTTKREDTRTTKREDTRTTKREDTRTTKREDTRTTSRSPRRPGR